MRTPLTTLKMAVLAPIPRASVTSAMEVNIGACPNRRRTCRRGLMASNTTRREFGSQRLRLDRDGPFRKYSKSSPWYLAAVIVLILKFLETTQIISQYVPIARRKAF